MTNKTVIFLMGPTASGKTKLAIDLATQYPIDIISVDSAMIYRGMDIGTGKPTAEELIRAPHALINIKDSSEQYSVAEFIENVTVLINNSVANNRVPVLVGGTMMYFKSLLTGLSNLPNKSDIIRENIIKEANKSSWENLYFKLQTLDPVTANKIKANDTQRIQRALEIIEITGQPVSKLIRDTNKLQPLDGWTIKQFALAPRERHILHELIEKRFFLMLEQGFILEVEKLYNRGDLNINLPSMRSVGYRQIWEYLADNCTYQQMIYKSLAATRQLAKRQFTWLRGWNAEVEWIHSGSDHQAISAIMQGY